MSNPRNYTVHPRVLPLKDPKSERKDQTCNASDFGPNDYFSKREKIVYYILHEDLRCKHLWKTGAAVCINSTSYVEQNQNTKRWVGKGRWFQIPAWRDESRFVWYVGGEIGEEGGDDAEKGRSDEVDEVGKCGEVVEVENTGGEQG
jgi:hypothetical protein